MNEPILDYHFLLAELLRSRRGEGPRVEDDILEDMDTAWLKLTESETAEVDQLGRRLSTEELGVDAFLAFVDDYTRIKSRIGNGVFTYAEAGSLTGLKPGRIRDWFAPTDADVSPLLRSDYAAVGGDSAISFLDLIDALVAGTLREEGVSLQKIRKIYTETRMKRGPHPFARSELYTDGKLVFLKESVSAETVHMLDIFNRQQVFERFVQPYLRSVTYDEATRLAVRWDVADGIVVDPRVSFGKPIISGTQIPTAIVAKSFFAHNENVERVAKLYRIKPDQVLKAVAFNSRMAA